MLFPSLHISTTGRYYLFCFVLTALCVTLLPLSQAYAMRPTLTLGAAEMCNSQHLNVIKKVYSAIFNEAGFNVKIVTLPLKRLEKMLKNGTLDGNFLRIQESDMQDSAIVRVNEPVFTIDYAIFTRNDKFSDIVSSEKITEHKNEILKIGYVRGSLSAEKAVNNVIHAHDGYPLNTHTQCLDMLRSRRIDMVIGPQQVLQCLIEQHKLQYGTIAMRGTISSLSGYIYLTKKHEALIPALESIIRTMKVDGSLQEIINAANAP